MTENEKADTSVEFVSDTRSSAGSDLPPPAYRKPYSNSIRIARILSTTLVFVSIVVGIVVLLALYLQTNTKCSCPVNESVGRRVVDDHRALPRRAPADDRDLDRVSSKKVPLKLMLDGKANGMMKKNKMSRVNCLVETKKTTQIIVPRPKMVITPFGNFSTDPHLIHIAGEKMIFSCFGENKKSKTKKPVGPRVTKRSAGELACSCLC
ncbi:uncharacterized protein [Centruroides vittatus]|uniref:uncharacterized protein n=1 Tax=Centruroides vittatus TaxID=120091 RepID=UPI003510379E